MMFVSLTIDTYISSSWFLLKLVELYAGHIKIVSENVIPRSSFISTTKIYNNKQEIYIYIYRYI